MISFKNIHTYSDFKSLQRIKKIKAKNCNNRYKTTSQYLSYEDYLNKKVGFECCSKNKNCCYYLNGLETDKKSQNCKK